MHLKPESGRNESVERIIGDAVMGPQIMEGVEYEHPVTWPLKLFKNKMLYT